MPTIGWIGSIQIRIYYDDHGVPHFHAVSPDFDVKIAIADCSVISGNGQFRGRDMSAIREWGTKASGFANGELEKCLQRDADAGHRGLICCTVSMLLPPTLTIA